MNGYKLKRYGVYFVHGSGFTGDVKTATVFKTYTDAVNKINCLASAGFGGVSAEEIKTVSFAVGYIRKGDLNANGSIKSNVNNPSRRRFATLDEAKAHGSRFAERKAKGSDVPGSAGHIGYYTIETYDPVNAEINWKTGLTNAL